MSSGRSVLRSITSAAIPSADERLGRLQRLVDAVHRGDDRDVRSFPRDASDPDRHELAVDIADDP